LESNILNDFNKNLVNLVDLETLIAADNNIKEIRSDFFTSNSKLKKIDLNRNNLDLITQDVFFNLTNLSSLSLSGTRQSNLFILFSNESLSKIEQIDLSDNCDLSSSIFELKFSGLKSLKIRNVSLNSILTVQNWLGLNQKLEVLDLSINALNLTSESSFLINNMTNFKELMLSNVGLKNSDLIELNDIDDVLVKLDLSSNKIESFPCLIVNNLSRLEYLDMSFNLIETIGECFQKNSILKYLFLNNNRIKYFGENYINLLTVFEI
jgi:Leucine-rich repeat (LRR) protein